MFGKNLKAVVVGLFVTLFAMSSAVMAQDMTGSAYSKADMRRYQQVKTGRVEAIRQVTRQIDASVSARATGAALGSVVAGAVGAQTGNNAGMYILAVIGGLGGDMVAKTVASEARPAIEMVIRLDQGGVIVVVQDEDSQWPIYQGDYVRLIEGNEVRVAPIR